MVKDKLDCAAFSKEIVQFNNLSRNNVVWKDSAKTALVSLAPQHSEYAKVTQVDEKSRLVEVSWRNGEGEIKSGWTAEKNLTKPKIPVHVMESREARRIPLPDGLQVGDKAYIRLELTPTFTAQFVGISSDNIVSNSSNKNDTLPAGKGLRHKQQVVILGFSKNPDRAQILWDDPTTQKRNIGWISASNISKDPSPPIGQESLDGLMRAVIEKPKK